MFSQVINCRLISIIAEGEKRRLERKIVFGMMLALLLIGILTLAFNSQLVRATLLRDVGIVNVVPSATEVYVGRVVNVIVVVQNEGVIDETFTVTCKYELEAVEHLIGTQTVTNLPPNTNTTLTFTWTTADITIHTIKAEASVLPYEFDTSDNNMTSPTTVKVKMLGDVNGDNTIDIDDVIIWANAFGSQPGDLNWNPQADLYQDSIIDIFDGVIIAQNFGETYP